jgi:chemotaxis protein methyltransferase CheR
LSTLKIAKTFTSDPLEFSSQQTTQLACQNSLELFINLNNTSDLAASNIKFQDSKIPDSLVEIENFLLQEKHELAMVYIQDVLGIDSKNVKAHFYCAQVYANLGQYTMAIRSCEQCLKINCFATEPYFLLANIAEEQGNLDEAKRLLKQIIYLEPRSAIAYLELSYIYKLEGDSIRFQKMKNSAVDILKALPTNDKLKETQNLRVVELLAELNS